MMLEKNTQKLAIVIPTRHEAGNILLLLGRIRAVLDGAGMQYEIIVVDDDSGDGIADLVLAASRTDARVRFLLRRGERGLSGAILHGWQCTNAEILGVMDADLQHPPELLPALLAAIVDGHDIAIASRYAAGAELGRWNAARRFISLAAVLATWPLQAKALRARDPLSGFFLVRRRCIDDILFRKTGFKLLLEILVRSRIRSVQEVPFTFGRRLTGRSKAGLNAAFEYAALLAQLYRDRLTRTSPRPPSPLATGN